ncbi:MAG: peptidoglycan-binding protein [Aureispira sp.]|nr:peptidoglycan-binding protein [Aureispira sp.]
MAVKPKEEVVEPKKEETVVEEKTVVEETAPIVKEETKEKEETKVEPPKPLYANKNLSGSVGRSGKNLPEDVKLVQEVLNKKGAKLTEDGLSGPATRKAIADFQLSIGFKKADSRVDPGGMTWKALIKGLDAVPEPPKEEVEEAPKGGQGGQDQPKSDDSVSTDQNIDNAPHGEVTGGQSGEDTPREQGGTVDENTTLEQVVETAPNVPENEPTFEVPEKALSELGNKAIPETTGIKELDEMLKKDRLTSEEIADARKYVASLSDAALRASLFRHLNAKVSYHSQRDNQSVGESESWDWTHNADGSKNMMVGEKIGDIQCNLTSLSMVLESLGISNPEGGMQFEDYLEKKGRDMSKAMDGDGDGKADGDVNYFLRDNPFGADEYDWDGVMDAESIGWGDVAQEMGAKVDQLIKDKVCDKDWFVENVLPRLDVGQGIILSIHGHVVRLQDMNKEGLIIDDPYGKLNVARGGFEENNGQGEIDEQADNVGEDNIWKWADVKQNKFTRVVAVYK